MSKKARAVFDAAEPNYTTTMITTIYQAIEAGRNPHIAIDQDGSVYVFAEKPDAPRAGNGWVGHAIVWVGDLAEPPRAWRKESYAINTAFFSKEELAQIAKTLGR